MEQHTAAGLVAALGYAAMLLAVPLHVAGFPVPQDLLLVTAGYLLFHDVFQWPAALAVCAIGVVLGDVLAYHRGRSLGRPDGRTTRAAPGRRREQPDYASNLAILASRVIPGARTSASALAGRQGMPLWRFLVVDLVGAALWVTLMLWIGHWGGALAAGATAGTNRTSHGGVFLAGAGATAIALKVWATHRATARRH